MRGVECIKLRAGQGHVEDCCRRCNKFLVSIKCEDYLHQLTDSHLLKTKSDQRREFVYQNVSFCMERYELFPFRTKFEIFLVLLILFYITQYETTLYTFM
jgi:hypothetical protein